MSLSGPAQFGSRCLLSRPFRFGFLSVLRFGRAIRRHQLSEPPVFIIGHWRSGTTNMHNLMLQDPQFASVTMLHCAIPSGFLTWEWLARWILSRRLPKNRPMDAVPLGIDEPMSEDFALAGLTHMSHYLNYFFPQNCGTDVSGDRPVRRRPPAGCGSLVRPLRISAAQSLVCQRWQTSAAQEPTESWPRSGSAEAISGCKIYSCLSQSVARACIFRETDAALHGRSGVPVA